MEILRKLSIPFDPNLELATRCADLESYEDFLEQLFQVFEKTMLVSWMTLSMINSKHGQTDVRNITYNADFDPSFWDYHRDKILDIDFVSQALIRLPAGQPVCSHLLFDSRNDEHVFVLETMQDKINTYCSMLVSIANEPDNTMFIGLFRELGMPVFCEEEARMVSQLCPLVKAILRHVQAHETANLLRGGLDSIMNYLHGESVLVDATHQVHHATEGWRQTIAPFLGDDDWPPPLRSWLTTCLAAAQHQGMPLVLSQQQSFISPKGRIDLELKSLHFHGGKPCYLVSVYKKPSVLKTERLKALGLTQRQIQVADYLPLGYSNQLIAKALGISQSGVKKHLRIISEKLGTHGRTELVARLMDV